MKRDNKGRFVKAVKAVKAVKVVEKKELVIGDKITSLDQLKEGMLVNFSSLGGSLVKGAIIVDDGGSVGKDWFAVHNCENLKGSRPSKEKMLGKKYGWYCKGRFKILRRQIDGQELVFELEKLPGDTVGTIGLA